MSTHDPSQNNTHTTRAEKEKQFYRKGDKNKLLYPNTKCKFMQLSQSNGKKFHHVAETSFAGIPKPASMTILLPHTTKPPT